MACNLARITALASDGFSSLSLSFVGMTGPDLRALNTVGLRPVAAKVGMEFAGIAPVSVELGKEALPTLSR